MINKRPRAFTLIELLVVIGIISILLAILIPVVSSMRITAQNAASTALVQRISAGIQLYYNEFRDYPGALHNSVYNYPPTSSNYMQQGVVYANFTQTEDMTLAILGGGRPGTTGLNPRIQIDNQFIGNGPCCYNTQAPKKYPAGTFMERKPEDLPGQMDRALSQQYDSLTYCTDSPAPEFLDMFGDDRRPILYMRANSGANVGLGYVVSDSYNANVSYNLASIKAYLKAYDSGAGDVLSKGASDSEVVNYFLGSTGNTAKFAGGYQLIGAGIDRKFGTPDDIRFGPGGGQ